MEPIKVASVAGSTTIPTVPPPEVAGPAPLPDSGGSEDESFASDIPWPTSLGDAVRRGLVGEVLAALEPETEADAAALLITLLVMVGSALGRTAHFSIAGATHHCNLFACLVGETSSGRKGTSLAMVRNLMEEADPVWLAQAEKSGLSSGEGVIWAVRDPITKRQPTRTEGRVSGYEDVIDDHGVQDKRALVVESEMAFALKGMSRDGNTLSAVLRNAWDGRLLQTMTKNNAEKATEPHISVLGHITANELARHMETTEMANGFGNRFLWTCTRRARLLPHGGEVPESTRRNLAAKLRSAIEFGRGLGRIDFDRAAWALWEVEYVKMTNDRFGLVGAMTGRAAPQVIRLATILAVLDQATAITCSHLEAGVEIWRYSEDSVRYIFQDSFGDPATDRILQGLKEKPEGLTRQQIRDLFNRHCPVHAIKAALRSLQEAGIAERIGVPTGQRGRPPETWRLRMRQDEKTASEAVVESPPVQVPDHEAPTATPIDGNSATKATEMPRTGAPFVPNDATEATESRPIAPPPLPECATEATEIPHPGIRSLPSQDSWTSGSEETIGPAAAASVDHTTEREAAPEIEERADGNLRIFDGDEQYALLGEGL